jgi:Cu+-exporting ATPase
MMMIETQEYPALVLPIEGMTCGVCVTRVDTALRNVPGVTHVEVSLSSARAIVRSEHMHADTRRIGEAVFRAGYIPGRVSFEFRISGMNCATCRSSVKDAIRSVRGVIKADLDFASGRARVEASANVAAATIVSAIERLGYGAKLVAPFEAEQASWRIASIRERLFGTKAATAGAH